MGCVANTLIAIILSETDEEEHIEMTENGIMYRVSAPVRHLLGGLVGAIWGRFGGEDKN
jgi:hypothetical protein